MLPTWFERQTVSLLEAMAAGMCVTASAVGGIPQVVGNEECGLLLPAKNPNALANALIGLFKEEELRKRMGQKARERIRREYDIEKYIGKLMKFYEEIM